MPVFLGSREDVDRSILVINPLPGALAHYERELLDTFARVGVSPTAHVIASPSAEGITGPIDRCGATLRLMLWRLWTACRVRRSSLIVLWPSLGYLDFLSWLPATVRHHVVLIVHDPAPLGDDPGHGRWAVRLARLAVRVPNLTFLTHTEVAAREFRSRTGIEPLRAGHPMLSDATGSDVPQTVSMNPDKRMPRIRVFGRYKKARTLQPLAELAADPVEAVLSIHGRGWPAVDGWEVDDRFVPEDELSGLIAACDCVVIPYRRYFQSGIAVRSLESGVRVVGPRTEHLVELFGSDWPGLVDDGDAWADAVRRVLPVTATQLGARRADARKRIDDSWRTVVGTESRVPAS